MKAALYSRRSRRYPSIKRSIVSTISFVGTILDYGCRFKMGLPDAYGLGHLREIRKVANGKEDGASATILFPWGRNALP